MLRCAISRAAVTVLRMWLLLLDLSTLALIVSLACIVFLFLAGLPFLPDLFEFCMQYVLVYQSMKYEITLAGSHVQASGPQARPPS